MKIIAGLVGGFMLSIIFYFVIGFMLLDLAGYTGISGYIGIFFVDIFFLMPWGLSILMAIKSSSAGKAWRRLLLITSGICFLAPISMLIVSVGLFPDSDTMATQAGAAIGAGLLTGAAGFVGFFLGVPFLIIGLLVGRDKKVIYIEKQPPTL